MPFRPSWDLLRIYQVGPRAFHREAGKQQRLPCKGLPGAPVKERACHTPLPAAKANPPTAKRSSLTQVGFTLSVGPEGSWLRAASESCTLHETEGGRAALAGWTWGQCTSSPSIPPGWASSITLWASTWSHDELCVGRQAHLFPRPMSGDPCRASERRGCGHSRTEGRLGAFCRCTAPFPTSLFLAKQLCSLAAATAELPKQSPLSGGPTGFGSSPVPDSQGLRPEGLPISLVLAVKSVGIPSQVPPGQWRKLWGAQPHAAVQGSPLARGLSGSACSRRGA